MKNYGLNITYYNSIILNLVRENIQKSKVDSSIYLITYFREKLFDLIWAPSLFLI